MNKKLLVPLVGAALVGGAVAGVGLTAFAAEGSVNPGGPVQGLHMLGSGSATSTLAYRHEGFGPPVMGKVTALSGSTITVAGFDGATYTIDASNASIEKYASTTKSAIGVSGIAVGDTIAVSGQVESATISAKNIRDGAPARGMWWMHSKKVEAGS